jgi:N-acetyl-anhydromuramyl-L-alanine amidase AmpD
MVISQAYASPNHNERTEQISAIIVHSCEGAPPDNEEQSSIPWLCNPASQVSTHYYITRSGLIYQLVPEERRAWHAGECAIADDANSASIGIELEHRQGTGAYPLPQRAALDWLARDIRKRYPIPLDRVVRHGTTARPVGRKHDPTDWTELDFRAWVASLDPPPVATSYTELSPILGTPLATRAQLRFAGKHGDYGTFDVAHILDRYYDLALSVSVDPCLAIAQMLHETADMTSFWSQRPQRNPAGIGVTGQYQYVAPINKTNWRYNTQRNQWERGLSFTSWADDAIPVHLGRLLSYALPAATGTQEQQALIQRSNAARPLPIRARGSATILREFGHVHNPALAGWASPGETYGIAIAARANRLIGYAP